MRACVWPLKGQIIVPSGIIPNAAGASHWMIFSPSFFSPAAAAAAPVLFFGAFFFFKLVSHWQRQMVKQKLAAIKPE